MFSKSKYSGYSADGRRIYPIGGGGGGKTPANTTQTVIQDVAPWAREAAKETLSKGMELTNQGYETYGGDRLAQYDPMQEQAYQGAANMGTASQLGDATRMAMQSGQYNPADFQNQYQQVGESWNPNAAQQYMSPYMEAALNPQLRSATRDAQLAQMQDQAQAVGRGAFGGSRTAIGQGMREQGLMQNLGDIRAKGYQTAYEQAAQQFQADQARKVQEAQSRAQFGLSADQAREQSRQFGSSAGLNAAQALGQLGQTEFQQGMDINKLRNTYGAQKQAQDQRAKDLAYQNFADQKNFDWEQIMRKADLLNRTPTGSSSTTSMYKAGPGFGQQAAALGTAAAGASQLFARGGLAYAGGGVTGDDNVASIVSSLSTEQLQQALTIAQQTGDPERIRIIAEELQSRGGEGGQGGAIPANSISAMATPGMVDNIMPTQEGMANGGIVAFAGGGGAEDEDYMPRLESPGNAELYNMFGQEALAALQRQKALKAPAALSDVDRRAAIKADYEELQSLGGPDPYADMQKKLAAREGKLAERDKQAKGLALLAAVPELLQGPNFAEAAGRGIGAAAKSYQGATAETDRRTEALQEAQFLMEDAKRKERMGDLKGARESVKAAEAARQAAYKEARATATGEVTGAASASKAFRPVSSGKGGASKEKLAEMLARVKYEDMVRINNALPKDQQRSDQELRRESAEQAMAESKTTDVGANKLTAGVEKDVAAETQDYLWSRPGREDVKARVAAGKTKAQAIQDITDERMMARRTEPALLPKRGTTAAPIKLD
jgi:hypothetical protein